MHATVTTGLVRIFRCSSPLACVQARPSQLRESS